MDNIPEENKPTQSQQEEIIEVQNEPPKEQIPTENQQDVNKETKEEEQPKSKYLLISDYGVSTEQNPRYRRTMEDGHIFIDNFGEKNNLVFAAVYDGHGGMGTVVHLLQHFHLVCFCFLLVLNNFVLKNLLENLNNINDVEEAFRLTHKITDDQIINKRELYSGSTTASVLIKIEDNKKILHAANAGDARAVLMFIILNFFLNFNKLMYFSRDGNGLRITYDHKATDQSEIDRINKIGGFVIGGRVNGKFSYFSILNFFFTLYYL